MIKPETCTKVATRGVEQVDGSTPRRRITTGRNERNAVIFGRWRLHQVAKIAGAKAVPSRTSARLRGLIRELRSPLVVIEVISASSMG